MTPIHVKIPPRQDRPATGQQVLAGAAKVDLTPIPGIPMGAYSLHGKLARGVWTRLFARAIYLQDATGKPFVLVSCDLLHMPAGLSDRVAARPLDFFADPFPQADVVTMGMILHDWNLERKMTLIRKAYDALPPGGAFIAIENLIDDSRRQNAFGLMMSLNMLIEFGDAFDFTAADLFGWCRSVGFRRTEVIPLGGPASAGIAYK